MPIRRFWLMNSMVGPLRAEQDLRGLAIASQAQGTKESLRDLRDGLIAEMGKPVLVFDVMDREGVARLKKLAG